MISPHTPPGTKIVALPLSMFPDAVQGPHPVIIDGETYTLREVIRRPYWPDGVYGVRIYEIDRRNDGRKAIINIRRFRRAELPSCLTELLSAAPVKQDAGAVDA